MPTLTVQSFGSGSSGNALLVEHGDAAVLVDCGVGRRELTVAARRAGRRLEGLAAVLVTHEHIDHVRALPYLAEGTPVIATAGTARMTRLSPARHLLATGGRPVSVGPFTVWALPVRHDALEPCGYLIETPGGNLAVLTDLGSWDDALAGALRHSDLVVLEANHDAEMLRRGPYPPHLKRRVASDVGHLANDACGRALAAALGDAAAAPTIWLAHLSATNNRADLAETAVRAELTRRDLALDVTALPRRAAGPRWQAPARPPGRGREWQPSVATAQLRLEFDLG